MDASFLRDKQARELRANRVKLVLMVVGLAVLVGAMVRLAQRRGTGQAEGEDKRPVSKQLAPEKPPVAFGREAPAPRTLAVGDDVIRKKFPYLTDPRVLEQISDQDTTLEPGPFFHMLYRVFHDKHEAIQAEAKPDVPWESFWKSPGPLRGQAVRVRGTIVGTWPQPLGDSPLGLKQVWAYRIRAEGAPQDSPGHLFDVYAIDKLFGALRYDQVTVYARFLKAQIIEPTSERFLEDPDLHVAVLVARRLEPLTYLDAPELPGPILDGSRPEARAFLYLLHRARSTPFEQLQAAASDKPTYLDFTNHPDRYRGKPVVVQGELRRAVRMPLPENLLRVPDVFYGQVVDADRKMNTFYVAHIPEGIHLKDSVLVYGYFLKNWSYVSQSNRVLSCPVIVGQRLVVLEYEPSYTMEIILGTIVVLTVAVLLMAHRREQARQAAVTEARRARQLARLPKDLNEVGRRLSADARGEAPPPPPPPPPPRA